MGIILQLKTNSDVKPDTFTNGIDKRSAKAMIGKLMDTLEKNMRKKIKVLTNDQLIEVVESSWELVVLNEEQGKKVILRDLIRNKIEGGSISDKFKETDQQLEQIVPRLISVLLETFSETDFVRGLLTFNHESNCKVQYSIEDLYTQVVAFADNVIKNSKNGYQGYRVKVNQEEGEAHKDKHFINLCVDVEALDWNSIRDGESAEQYKNYQSNLGLYVSLTNTENNKCQVYKLKTTDIKPETVDGIKDKIKIQVPEAGKYTFKSTFSDCYGFSTSQVVSTEAK